MLFKSTAITRVWQVSGRQLELDLARDAGVYENQPEVREDVIRANDDEPEMIPVAQLRSTRALWNRKEQEEQQQSDKGARSGKKIPPEVRFTIIYMFVAG
jgi:hypothetical protein